ncbi:Uncharacterised protein [Mycobacteroides abscessus subsp. abscessus]|nr:Uncharacterised protein [Mycobacteroides abscessus subsp. abscessus]
MNLRDAPERIGILDTQLTLNGRQPATGQIIPHPSGCIYLLLVAAGLMDSFIKCVCDAVQALHRHCSDHLTLKSQLLGFQIGDRPHARHRLGAID